MTAWYPLNRRIVPKLRRFGEWRKPGPEWRKLAGLAVSNSTNLHHSTTSRADLRHSRETCSHAAITSHRESAEDAKVDFFSRVLTSEKRR
jgi:hypothetical protein